MSISEDKKKSILLDSFETLKESAEEHADALKDLLCEMSSIDSSLAIEMWEHLLEENKRAITSQKERDWAWSTLTTWLHHDFRGGVEEINERVFSRGILAEMLYRRSGQWCDNLAQPIVDSIEKGDLDTANYLIGLLHGNKLMQQGDSFGEILKDILERQTSFDEPATQELFESWSKKMTRIDQAKFNVALLKKY